MENPMANITKLMAVSTLAVSSLLGCASTTDTGALGVKRNQLLLVSNEQIMQLSAKKYYQTIQQARVKGILDTNKKQVARLEAIAKRLIGQVGVYRPSAVNWNWEVHTIKSKQMNAFVMPGGKVMFYSGIIDRLDLTDDEIAAIMGHEMAHALREHSRERISGAYATQLGLGALVSGLGLSSGQAQLAGVIGDIGIQRPHSRVQESEADVMGLELMARAGYNPEAAITLWQKMQKAGGGSVPQFLSTHPSDVNRINKLESLIPKVMPFYRRTL